MGLHCNLIGSRLWCRRQLHTWYAHLCSGTQVGYFWVAWLIWIWWFGARNPRASREDPSSDKYSVMHLSEMQALETLMTGLCSLQYNGEGIASKILPKSFRGFINPFLQSDTICIYWLLGHATRPMCWSSSLRSLKRTGWWMGLQCLFTSVW